MVLRPLLSGGMLLAAMTSIPKHRRSSSRIRAAGADVSVQPVVVLWADFEQRSIMHDNVAWVRGDQLIAALARQPVRYRSVELGRLTSATRAAVQSLRQEVGTGGTHAVRAGVEPRSSVPRDLSRTQQKVTRENLR